MFASDGELMGPLCLLRKAAGFSRAEEKLLAALASHAALSMEKVRRFSQLERSKKQWVEDIDAISDYIAVHDQAWKIVRTNRSLATELGIPPAALVGEPISSLRHIAETGSALPCPFCRDTREAREEYIATSAGRTFLVSTSRTRGATEEESRTIHVLKDITDRREAERRYRELFDSIQEGLFFATPEGQFLDVNDALVRMLGYESAEELLRADVSAHLYPTPAAKARLVSAIAERGALRNYEETLRKKDGGLLATMQDISAVRDEANQVNNVVVVMTDITDAALLQAKLAHAEKMATIGRLVSGVAHEVNNPLAAILGFTDLLLENPEMPTAAREDLQIILQETQRTKEIVQDLLSFARQRPTQKEPGNVNAVRRQTIKLRSYDFSSHGVEVSEEFEANLSPTLGDAQQLQQVFLNILNNAYDAIQESGNHGRIRIRTRRAEDDVEVAFMDNGTGVVDPERIFDPFFTTKQAGKSTGLGVSICYGIVRAPGGEIFCWDNEGGRGGTFVVGGAAAKGTSLGAAVKEAGR